jgi:hypothetical protein
MVQLLVHNFDHNSFEFPPETAITIEMYLKTKPHWKPHLSETILMFGFLSHAINDMMNVFGYLDSIKAQFIEMQKRLAENKFAILRTDGDNAGSFYIFEPKEDLIYFSFLKDLPLPYQSFFPQVPSPFFHEGRFDQQSQLYDYVEQNRLDLILTDLQPVYVKEMLEVPFSKTDFLTALLKQIDLATKLIQFVKSSDNSQNLN